MKRFRRFFPFWTILFLLLAYVFLVYGALLGKLGIYWDDWAYIWTRLELGYHGLLRHFSFSRPLAGQLHNIAILVTNGSPFRVQLYGMLMQVFGSCMIALLVRKVWRNNRAAALAALFFIAYPGFTMQPVAINFSFSYFLIGILCLSFVLSVQALRIRSSSPEVRKAHQIRAVVYIITAILLSLLNLFASEYFFLLELLRPLFFYCEALEREESFKKRLLLCLRWELPYALAFCAGMLYRMFFNQTQTLHYSFSLLEKFKVSPFHALGLWLQHMAADCWSVVFKAWVLVFEFPDVQTFGTRSTLIYVLICLLTFLLVFLFLLHLRSDEKTAAPSGRLPLQLILIGIACLLLGGQPFWLTESELSFTFPNSRYTLPFMLGVCFILSGLLCLIRSPRFLPVLAASLLVGLAAGGHFVSANQYRRDWTLTKDFFWQLKWRVPAIEENTVVVTNVLPIHFSTDNSLTAPLNWIYAQDYQVDRIPYILYTNTKREKTLSGLESGHEVFQEYLSAQFFGNTRDMLSVYYNAPGCVHVLDPEIDCFNQTIPEVDRDAAVLNNYQRIRTDQDVSPLPQRQFGEEPRHGWCWYYETADLSCQKKDWRQVAELGDEAFSSADHPNDPMERIPFIEGYAHMGRWEDALEQTYAALKVTPVMNDPLCALWNRIDRNTGESAEKTSVLTELETALTCDFLR